MLRRAATGLIVLLLVLLPLGLARAEEPWANEPGFKSLVKAELSALRSLMRESIKKDYRRQAWYFADRVLQVDPADSDAATVLDQWSADELQQGQVPKKGFINKRNGILRKLGDDYFHFGELLEGSGMEPVKYYPINVRASSYGSQAGPLLAAMKNANYIWLGVYGPKEKGEVEKLLNGYFTAYTFSQEYDDEYLGARSVWPEARGAMWRSWRLLTDHDYKESLRLLGMLAAAESWLVDQMGSKARKNDDTVTNLMVFGEWQKYDKIGAELVRESDREHFKDTSGWHDRRRNRLMVCWRHRCNGWLGDDDLMLGHASKIMARKHFAGGAGGDVQGRGFWLLDGLRGAFEGFRVDKDGRGEIDAAACWRLAIARALRDQGKLIPWDEFMQLNQATARAMGREETLKIQFGGAEREAKKIDRVTAQATALVVGLMKADRGKRLGKLGKLIGELYKRDSLPDVDKALGLKKGRAVAMANIAMDAAHGKRVK
jgi:hypothetical protein